MLSISQIPLGSIQLMVKHLTVVNGKAINFLGLFSLKFHQNSAKSYKITFGMQRSMCEKVGNFKSVKADYFKMKIFCK